MMRVTARLVALATLAIASSASASSGPFSQTWFLRQTSDDKWCTLDSPDSYLQAELHGYDRFDWSETGRIRYRGSMVASILVSSQSEDAYVEDTYTLDANSNVRKAERKGHYVSDPFAHATFVRNGAGQLVMSPKSRKLLARWRHTTYFFEWPLYSRLDQMPFGDLAAARSKGLPVKSCDKP